MKKRVFLIILDSFGIGAQEDAYLYGDEGANTLLSCYKTGLLNIPNLSKMGLFKIDGVEIENKCENVFGAYGRCHEKSAGKDTTTGHREIAGLITNKPFPTYPDGFPKEIIEEFERRCNVKTLCNKPYSGTEVIRDYGKEHLKTGALIVYTSADSVFQIAAHEDIVPVERLYEYCRIAREILVGENSVDRVIARPFTGKEGEFSRTLARRDFASEPCGKTMLDYIKDCGLDCISVGKISDIFAHRGITLDTNSHGNTQCMQMTENMLEQDFSGLCFVNLVDFDSSYGHRNNPEGYARELCRFDEHLGRVLSKLKEDDLLIVTADHGCDPDDDSFDHTREYTPLLVCKKGMSEKNLGTRESFCDIAKTVCEYLDVQNDLCGKSFLGDLT